MEAKADPSRVLMSEILEGNVAEVEPTEAAASFIVAILAVLVSDGAVETVVGSAVTYLFDEHYEIETRVMMDDAFALSQAWPNLRLAGFELHLGTEVCAVKGPLKVTALRVQDVDPQRQTGVLAMKLCRE